MFANPCNEIEPDAAAVAIAASARDADIGVADFLGGHAMARVSNHHDGRCLDVYADHPAVTVFDRVAQQVADGGLQDRRRSQHLDRWHRRGFDGQVLVLQQREVISDDRLQERGQGRMHLDAL